MKVVFIYGPPAVGKLTVAKELSKITGFNIFDEHLLIDTAERFFAFKSKPFIELHHKMRELILNLLIQNKTDFIVTYCPSYPKYNKFWLDTLKRLEKRNGSVKLVRLECRDSVLFERVKHEGRKPYTKAKTIKAEKQMLKVHRENYKTDFNRKDIFVINNSHMSAKKVASMIKKHYKL